MVVSLLQVTARCDALEAEKAALSAGASARERELQRLKETVQRCDALQSALQRALTEESTDLRVAARRRQQQQTMGRSTPQPMLDTSGMQDSSSTANEESRLRTAAAMSAQQLDKLQAQLREVQDCTSTYAVRSAIQLIFTV